MFFCGAAYLKSQSAVFMLPEKGVPSAVSGTVRRWCQDYAAGLEESSTGEVPQLQKFCCHNCWVLAAPRKSKRQLTAESAECCRTETAVVGQVERRLPGQRLANHACHFELDVVCDWQKFRSQTLSIMRQALTLLQIFAISQFGCGGREFQKNLLKRTTKGNHWG